LYNTEDYNLTVVFCGQVSPAVKCRQLFRSLHVFYYALNYRQFFCIVFNVLWFRTHKTLVWAIFVTIFYSTEYSVSVYKCSFSIVSLTTQHTQHLTIQCAVHLTGSLFAAYMKTLFIIVVCGNNIMIVVVSSVFHITN